MTPFEPARIRAVLLDAGNTLVFLDLERLLPVLREHGARVELRELEAAERAARSTLLRNLPPGANGMEMEAWRAYFLELMTRVGVAPHDLPRVGERVRAFHHQQHLWTRTEPGTRQVLERLQGDGYRLGVISNADGRIEAALQQADLHHVFEFILDSDVVGIEKPDPAIFREAAWRMGLEAERCLYVGDLFPVDVQGAWRAGMAAVLVDPLGEGHPVPEEDVVRIPSVQALPSLLEGRFASLEDP